MINKGEELYLCLRHTKEKNYEFNDKNIFGMCIVCTKVKKERTT